MGSKSTDSALEGIRVLEICDDKGSYCGKLLADMGAEVIKLEASTGNSGLTANARATPPLWPGEGDLSCSLSFLYNNTNKKSICVDIESADGQRQVRKLASSCDLVIESLAPGGLAALNLGVETMLSDNPGLVVTSITGFGQSGPHRDYQSADIVASALGGAMVVTGFADDPPVKLCGSQSFVMASTMAAVSSMIALHHSQQTGVGQQVDISIQETMLAVTSICGIGKWLEDDIVSRRYGTGLFAAAPSGTYPCKDGDIYLIINRPLHWQVLAKWINEVSGNQEVLDPMFEGTSAGRLPYRELLDIFITELTQEFTVEEFYREGQRRHLAVTPLSTAKGVTGDQHLNARGFYVDVEHGEGNTLRYPGAPYRLSQTPWRIKSPAPTPGAHTGEVLTGLEEERESRQRSRPGNALKKAGEGALAGLRVVEFGAGMAGPWIGRHMAFCGADVIRVESKGFPDVTRLFVPPKAPELGLQPQMSPWLTDWNAGKRYISLDLTRPEAPELIRRLIACSDIVIDNNGSGVLEKFGLGFDQLTALQPELIVLSSTGFGRRGPDANYISWGPNIETLSGLANLSGFAHRDCTMTQFAYPDPLSALYGLFSILCALHYRGKTGKGQQIELAQLEATVASIGDVLMEVYGHDREPQKPGNRAPDHAPQGCYPCLDESGNSDRWCAISIADEQQWKRFCQLLGKSEWIVDPRFNSVPNRQTNHTVLDELIGEWTIARDPYEVMHCMQQAGIAAGVAQTVEDQWLNDPHLKARHFFEQINHAKKGSVFAPGLGLGLSRTPGKTSDAGGAIGRDNRAVFCQLLGMGDAEFDEYVASGVIENSE
jgi:crotonobetainyl-CoA:carnitine CoA-transferase CaiB-like acyl-CoA transferase